MIVWHQDRIIFRAFDLPFLLKLIPFFGLPAFHRFRQAIPFFPPIGFLDEGGDIIRQYEGLRQQSSRSPQEPLSIDGPTAFLKGFVVRIQHHTASLL